MHSKSVVVGMDKPSIKTVDGYSYLECSQYLEWKYGHCERDFAGKYFQGEMDENKSYLDFWHWVVKKHTVVNGCWINFSREEFDEISIADGWIRTIYDRYLKEFADGRGDLTMIVEW